MFKKIIISIICVFLLVFNANAGSDGELALNKKEPKEKCKICIQRPIIIENKIYYCAECYIKLKGIKHEKRY